MLCISQFYYILNSWCIYLTLNAIIIHDKKPLSTWEIWELTEFSIHIASVSLPSLSP